MPETGKIDRDFFAEYIAPRLGASRADVHTGPKHGVDFGVVEVGGQALVVATDPISVLPALGFERAGRFAVRFVLADVAVSGIAPTHLAISFSLPPEMADEEFAAVWRGVDAECRDLGVAVTTGHTARYADASFPWVGAGTAFGVGDPGDIVFPDGARPGDALVVTRGPAVETTGLLTTLFPDQVDLPPETLAVAQERLADTGVVRDALAASEAGAVSAMHDATEGGLLGALFEMADSAGVRLSVESESVPTMAGVCETCETLGLDPWRATTGGTLVVAVAPDDADAVVAALDDRGTPAAVVGQVESGDGVARDGKEQARPGGDASWPVYERLLDERVDEQRDNE
jgi:hydrogenase expression/formation protein HypE